MRRVQFERGDISTVLLNLMGIVLIAPIPLRLTLPG